MRAESMAAAGLQAAVNRVLALDPELAEDVAELEGEILEVRLQGLGRRLQLHGTGNGVAVVAVGAGEEDFAAVPGVTISGPPFTLLRMLGAADTVEGMLPEDVSVSGDVQLLQRIARIAGRARLDWEEPLSRVLGDSLAHEVGRGVRGIAAHLLAASDTLTRDVGEYLQEESRLSPTRIEVEDFAAAVDRIRDDVERLEARIARLPGGAGRAGR